MLSHLGLTSGELAALVVAVGIAGLVRGFSGFGSALIFMPVAGAVLPPATAVTVLMLIEGFGPLPNLPSAIRGADRREVALLIAGFALALPAGLWALLTLSVDVFRWAIFLVCAGMLAAMMRGWRWHGAHNPAVTLGAGVIAGGIGGATGMAGPPVILYSLAGTTPAAVVRANLLVFFVLADIVLFSALVWTGSVRLSAFWVAGALIVPFLLANVAGARLFRPDREHLFRRLAYAVIAGSAVSGLPIWG